MSEKEDVEDFFAGFEGHMISHGVGPDEWTKCLAPTLTVDVNSTYIRINTADKVDYEKVKEKLLEKYLVTQDTYRLRLDQFTRKKGENWKECLDRLYHLYNKWTVQCKDQKYYLGLLTHAHLVKIMPRSTSTNAKDKSLHHPKKLQN